MKNLVLLTGATGFLGPHVMNLLIQHGYQIRVAGPDYVANSDQICWRDIDFLSQVDYDALLDGVSIVVHLAAELHNMKNMEQINVEASKNLAIAAEKNGADLFVYTSSVGVYGFPEQKEISELTPTLSLSPDDKNIFLAENFLYEYSMSKLKGENEIKKALETTPAIFFRPSNMVDEKKINDVLEYGLMKRIWRGSRITHHIYVKDVAEAILFAVKKVKNPEPKLSRVEIYNLSNDIKPNRTYKYLFDLYVDITGDRSKSCPIATPIFLDYIKDIVKFRKISRSLPAGAVNYSPKKLIDAGFCFKYGIENFYKNMFRNILIKK